MSDKHWKAAERWYAKRLTTGRRNPVTGERAGADVESDLFALQVKRGYRMPGYLREWLEGIVMFAGRYTKPFSAVVWQEKGGWGDESVVVMRWSDFAALHNTYLNMEEALGHHERQADPADQRSIPDDR